MEDPERKAPPKINGINIRIEDHRGKGIVIHAKDKEIILKPNDRGICFVPYNDVLLKENPMVSLPDSKIDTMEVVTDKAAP